MRNHHIAGIRVLSMPFRWLVIACLSIICLILASGVYAANNFVLNSGDPVNLGAGSQKVNPCDDDVNLSAITYNDGNNIYLQGFQYDNADKPACVGYDFETRFIRSDGLSAQVFATSSISSEPEIVRVFAPTSSGSWQIGLGAQPSVEVTVTQLSQSSFKVIFANPISLVSDLGKLVMAEVTHLPLGTFTNGLTQIGTTTGNWENSCFVSNSSQFYALEVTNGVYKSTVIPSFPASISNIGSSLISSPALTGGSGWYGLGCSEDGKYLAASGTSNRIAFSSDYGVTWQTKSASSYNGTGTVGGISISNDGKVVAISVGSTPGYFNFWVNGNFWTSTTSPADGSFQVAGARAATVRVCGNGTTIYGGGGTNSAGLYRWQTSSITSGGNKASVTPANTNNSFGTYLLQIDCSADGQSAVIASYTNSNVYVTRNQFQTYYSPSGLSTSTSGVTTRPQTVSMSSTGRFVAVGTGDAGGAQYAIGVTQFSTDFGQNLTNTSYINHYMQTITISSDGSRLVTGGAVSASKFVIMGSN
jgi:hypothetical protein